MQTLLCVNWPPAPSHAGHYANPSWGAMMRVELQDLLKLWSDLGLTILFVTHDLDEALYVAQRVILLSASPGTIAENVAVPLPYPRLEIETRSEPEYLRLREHLYRNMVAQVMAGRADVP